jgi:hypothetical protein
VAVVITYSISLFKKTGAQNSARGSAARRPSIFRLLSFQTFQYGALAVFWLVSKHHLLKLTPYLVYSSLQLLKFVRDSSEDKTKFQGILNSESTYKLERVVADNNILLFLRLLLDLLMVRPGSGVSLLIYMFYFRLTMELPPTKDALDNLEDQADKIFTNKAMPAIIQDLWKKAKWSIDHASHYQLLPSRQTATKNAPAAN